VGNGVIVDGFNWVDGTILCGMNIICLMSIVVSEKSSTGSVRSSSDLPTARIDSPSPSVGIAAVRLLDIKSEKKSWRNIARDWCQTGRAAWYREVPSPPWFIVAGG